MAATDRMASQAGDIHDQVADLRAQLNSLIEDRAMPMIAEAREGVAQKVDELGGQVRARPFTVIAVTAVVAFIAGRLLR